jgi:hypothetical protein
MHKLLATFLLLSLSLPAQVFAGPAEDADAAYARGDHVGALKIYQALAADGLAPAQFNLGVMYDFGQGVAKDPVQAVRWYRAAAAQGHGGAQFNLGGMYFDGVGVAQDHMRSYVWFTLAAAAGAAGASRNRSALAKLLDVAQMEQAQRLVRDCLARNFAGCV